eukprot:Awhi_evm2s11811
MAYAIARTWDLSWGNRPAGSVAGTIEPGSEEDIALKHLGLLLTVMASNIGLCLAFVNFLDMTTIFIISISIVGVALSQQVLSMIYYLFVTDHMMTASLDTFSKKTLKAYSFLSFVITMLGLSAGVFTNTWISNRILMQSFVVREQISTMAQIVKLDGLIASLGSSFSS